MSAFRSGLALILMTQSCRETYGEDDFLPGPSRARRIQRPHTMVYDGASSPDDGERIQYVDSDHEDEEDVGSPTSMSGSEVG